jgi:hypothetical protein
VKAAPLVRSRRFDNDVVIVDLEGGAYYALDEVGARMWALLNSGQSPLELATTMAAEYAADKEQILVDCLHLVRRLLDLGLMEVTPP